VSAEALPRVAAGSRTWSVLDLLRWTTQHFASVGIDTPRLDAECLLAAALGSDRLRLYLDFDKPVGTAERARFRELVRRRAGERVPVAQLTGRREFWSLPLRVTPDVLAPRPETETLIETALALFPDTAAPLRIADLGTGSGAIALALAHERPRAQVVATDLSPAALAVARANAVALGLEDRVALREGDLFAPIAGERFDLVVSNPPYLAHAERAGLAPELAHEPDLALFADDDGLAVLRRLVAAAPGALAPGGWLLVELAPAQADAVRAACAEAGLEDASVHLDLARRPRVVSARRPREAD
jgi:release factor glutamine methyltransferase